MRERSSIKTVALPAANASASTAALRIPLGPHRGAFEFHLELPATPSLVNTKKITVTLEESDVEGSGFAAMPTTGNMIVTGPASGGGLAALFRLYCPPVHKEWVRATVAVETGGGDNTAKSLTFAIDI